MSEKKFSGNEFKAGDKFFGQMKEAGIADEAFIREIVVMFLEEGQQSLNELRAAFDSNSPEAVKLFAHKLKSSFLMFDMHEAHTLAVKLEKTVPDLRSSSAEDLKQLESICSENFRLLKLKYLK